MYDLSARSPTQQSKLIKFTSCSDNFIQLVKYITLKERNTDVDVDVDVDVGVNK